MGASESTDSLRADVEARELRELKDQNLQDGEFPWFFIIQWACEKIPSDAVFKWSLPDIKADVADLTADPSTFLASCPPDEAFRKSGEFSFGDNSVFLEWACLLLEVLPSLGPVRYKLVPAKLSEEEFWCRYFSAVRRQIQQHVLAAAEEDACPRPSQSESPFCYPPAGASSSRRAGNVPPTTLPPRLESGEGPVGLLSGGEDSSEADSAQSAPQASWIPPPTNGDRPQAHGSERAMNMHQEAVVRHTCAADALGIAPASAAAEWRERGREQEEVGYGQPPSPQRSAFGSEPRPRHATDSAGTLKLQGGPPIQLRETIAEDPRFPTLIGAPTDAAASSVRTHHYVMHNGVVAPGVRTPQ
ncbi:BSD domain-containing protein [Besnoitia besnoiti]|uniref:BSD domain-containing protein n=1 Tax=Besnoitia besnoiti TaxID=94643 RepID=A0A2A9MLK0_BESBE|nr:BSD domain-containing protein [Besnoitia besnoiti]PFH36583.1 BSD domain-containing protein [Besnoitia besnoiti]